MRLVVGTGLGLAIAGVLWIALMPPAPPAGPAAGSLSAPPKITEIEGPKIGEIVPRADREVTPENITQGPSVTGPLVRVEGPKADPVPRRKPRPELVRLFRITVTAAGQLQTKDRSFTLAGVRSTAINEMCGPDGDQWPCGRMARAAFQRLIGRRAIECEIPVGLSDVPDPARCLLGGRDLSEWLVAQGWAKPAPGLYSSQVETASAEELGIWSPVRPGAVSVTRAEPDN